MLGPFAIPPLIYGAVSAGIAYVLAASDPLLIAGIVAIPTTLVAAASPLVASWLNGKQDANKTKANWEREDQVADKAAAVAASAAQAAELLRVATAAQGSKLAQIHVLVNSNMTAEMKGRLVALRGQLVLMGRVLEMTSRTAGGRKKAPDKEAVAALTALKKEIEELEATLEERARQTEIADKLAASNTASEETQAANAEAARVQKEAAAVQEAAAATQAESAAKIAEAALTAVADARPSEPA